MIVLRSTKDAAVAAERERGAHAVMQLAQTYGAALNRVSALQQQMQAWVLNEAGNITPEQMAQMFYAQDDRWQAAFFNTMQEQVIAYHGSLPPPRPGEVPACVGVPAGEGQWYHMAGHLNAEGFETLKAMFEHAKHLNAGEVTL